MPGEDCLTQEACVVEARQYAFASADAPARRSCSTRKRTIRRPRSHIRRIDVPVRLQGAWLSLPSIRSPSQATKAAPDPCEIRYG